MAILSQRPETFHFYSFFYISFLLLSFSNSITVSMLSEGGKKGQICGDLIFFNFFIGGGCLISSKIK